MATVSAYDTAKGKRYRVRYRTPQGRQTDKRGFTTKKAAEAFAATVEVDKLRGTYIAASAGRVTIGELYEQWRDEQVHLKDSSLERYRASWSGQVEPEWAPIAVADVEQGDVQAWIARMSRSGLSPSTVRKAHHLLSMIVDTGVRDRCVAANLTAGVTLPRLLKKEPTFLSSDRVLELAGNSGRGELVTLTLGFTGLRWGEMAAMRVKRWDSQRRRLAVAEAVTEVNGQLKWGTPKTHEVRSVPVPGFLAARLDEAVKGRAPDDLLFPARGGGVMRNKNARRDWFDAAVLATFPPTEEPEDGKKPVPSLEVTPHDLRHSAASIAIRAGANVKAVQRMLGHASASMTLDIYGHLFEDDLDDVAAAIDADINPTGANVLPLRMGQA
ncbi:site-specific integrase [Rhodococcus sp. HM1]|uniref:site-specific integrase n=1 Tax=Rhodococcus sp. HM1 TaxID=2937759 RepID=UPI00200B0477|nr:site-specific integrase [Rhodococcus sp. HM1]MCK8674145.1 site-specific integrase [Rhodococcus sp. HM1]